MAGPIVRSSNLQFFLARAEQARVEAEAATLDHVRERCRRSEAAWSALADKAQRGERLRIEDQKRKAAEAASILNEDDIQEEPAQAGIPMSGAPNAANLNGRFDRSTRWHTPPRSK